MRSRGRRERRGTRDGTQSSANTTTKRAVRAVGTAVGRNPISFLIPCHRALRKSGELGGYHWGLPVKRAILAWESARDFFFLVRLQTSTLNGQMTTA